MVKEKELIPGGTYKSSDGTVYFIHFISTHTETGEAAVVYEVYDGHNQTQHCPVDKFMENHNLTLVRNPQLIPMD